jgi:hypothetical protein
LPEAAARCIAKLRRSGIDGVQHSTVILKLPGRQRSVNCRERAGVHCILGFARNAQLEARLVVGKKPSVVEVATRLPNVRAALVSSFHPPDFYQ